MKSIIDKSSLNLNLQIIVVDNQSKIDDYQYMLNTLTALSFSNLEIHRNNVNSGFGGGNMYGFQFVKAPFTAFINNDTWFLNDCLEIVRNQMLQNPNMGVGGAQAFKENGDFMISLDFFASPAREILGRSILEFISSKKYPKRKKRYSAPTAVPFVPG
ncbi:glycosyltransferase, partial [Arthrospira platensis SPKY1]|nr:glycosyltransferase [Arthrospira platensis SPKY1]